MIEALILIVVGALSVLIVWGLLKLISVVFSKLFFPIGVLNVCIAFAVVLALFLIGLCVMLLFFALIA